ncbi:hypothetical protein HLB44_26430 [Aquincola sp. S2]|uniref:Uncharacterized protein n=1 Tax=Pseudaquabacterium terrae TaxID=2732868 RepID=A0ABX2EPB6_9BURK|nr:hypothetical protein [Aquabacterium terrae]NRF70547.1 hypothetical protein [Aquabacterium terrae]
MSKVSTPIRSKSAPAKARGATAKRAKPRAAGGKRITKIGPAEVPQALAGSNEDAVRTKTLRLQPSYEKGLVILKRILKMPINKMVNEAVGEYIQRRTAEVESELTTTLEQLHAYRLADPDFVAARQAFVEGEALYGKDDPMEGRIVRVKVPARDGVKPGASAPPTEAVAAGPALRKVRELLRR